MGARQNLEENFDFEIVDEFLEHFSVMLDIMESLIITLEKPDNYAENINELFRIFHNLKSASSFLKLQSIMRLTTFVESYLDLLRQSSGPANDEVVTWLLQINDMLVLWYDDLKLDRELSKINFSLLKLPDMDIT